jgi:hypothetical protein
MPAIYKGAEKVCYQCRVAGVFCSNARFERNTMLQLQRLRPCTNSTVSNKRVTPPRMKMKTKMKMRSMQ